MREFPSCFGENGVQVADSSSSSTITTRSSHNVVTCVYLCKLQSNSCLITVSWTKALIGQGLSVGIDDFLSKICICKFDIKPLLFSRRKGSKNFEVPNCKIHIFWDLSYAKFGSGPEPLEGYYVAILFNNEIVLVLGDLKKEVFKKIDSDCGYDSQKGAIFIAKKEHIFGKKIYSVAKAQFHDKGKVHNVTIECDTNNDPFCLVIRVDHKVVMNVKRLKWKFRGNHTIFVDGVAVEVFWDVHNWLFGNSMGNAVFMFQSCVSSSNNDHNNNCDEKKKIILGKSVSDDHDHSGGSLTWAYSQQFKDSQLQGLGFSLILYAWKNE